MIPQTVRGAISIMEAAIKEPSVKEFVYTSSIVASTMPAPGNTTFVGPETYNETAIKLAWDPERIGAPGQGGVVYSASKAEAEKAVFRFVEERKPHFTVNSVGPSTIIGEPLHQSQLESAGAWLKMLYDGKTDILLHNPAIYSVDVKDVGLLHVAAVLDPEVKNTRLQAWAHKCNWNDILAIARRQCPERNLIDDLPGLSQLSVGADFSQPLALLKKWAGQDGWRALEQTVAENINAICKWDPECDPCGTGWMP